jgi:NAD(P)-dependent dehydrogenase (short-subunit alcohol dehydrogenase family)
MSFQDLLSYEGKRAVVTGAASGMGNATVKYLADLGAEIVAVDVAPIEDGPWTTVHADLGDRASIDAAVAEIGGPVDRLFNVAGIAGGRGKEKITMMINFFGLRYFTERLLPHMPAGGSIVNVSSLAGFRFLIARPELEPMLGLATMEEASEWLDKDENQALFNGYGTTKELLNLWSVASCQELAERHGLRVNVVAPGSTDTPLLEDFKANARERTGSDDVVMAAKGFLGRFAHAEDQAAACVFLNSDAAAMITGQVVHVDGGMAGSMSGGSIPMVGVRER